MQQLFSLVSLGYLWTYVQEMYQISSVFVTIIKKSDDVVHNKKILTWKFT